MLKGEVKMKAKKITILLPSLLLIFTVYFFSCTSFEGLIKQGKLLEAEEYCEQQNSSERSILRL